MEDHGARFFLGFTAEVAAPVAAEAAGTELRGIQALSDVHGGSKVLGAGWGWSWSGGVGGFSFCFLRNPENLQTVSFDLGFLILTYQEILQVPLGGKKMR